ncbi:MAG: immunoglobulin domain-containing protein, partial [Chitinivibrionales bacterium]|nr:immunoglobulin domain-containing protein [Chitinivibrionales bacterium]
NNAVLKQVSAVYIKPGLKTIRAAVRIKNSPEWKADQRQISIGMAPLILNGKKIIPSNNQPMIDSSLILQIEVKTFDTTSFEWFKNDTLITNPALKAGGQLRFDRLKRTDQGRYRCVVSNADGADTALPFMLSFSQPQPPVITLHPQSQTVTTGSRVRFTCAAKPAVRYQWIRNDSAIAQAVHDSLILPSASLYDNNTRFRCRVSTPDTAVESNEAILRVVDSVAVPRIVKQPENKACLRGRPATFSLEAVGTNLVYQWYKNATAIAGATKAAITIPYAEITDNGAQFTCTVANTADTLTSEQAALTVWYVEIKSQPQLQEVQIGQKARFSITVESNPTVRYQWLKNNAPLTGANGAVYTTEAVTLGDNNSDYACRVSLENNLFDTISQTAKLLVRDSTIVITTHPRDTGVKENENAEFQIIAAGSNLIYQWQKDGQNIGGNASRLVLNSVQKGDNGRRIRCIVSNGTGSISSNEALLSVYYIEILQEPKSPGTVVVGTTFCLTVDCQGNPQPRYDWRRDSVSVGTAMALNILSAGFVDAGTYWCRLYNDKGIERKTADVKVAIVDKVPVIVQQPRDATVMAGGTAVFSLKAEGTNLRYEWIGVKDGPDGPQVQWSNAAKSDNGRPVSCRVSNSSGSVVSDTAHLTVLWQPDKLSVTPVSVTVSETDSFRLTAIEPADKGNPPAAVFQWYRGSAPIQTGGAIYRVAKAQISDSGSYFCAYSWNNQSQPAGASNIVRVIVTEKNEPPKFTSRYYTLAINQGKNTFKTKEHFTVKDPDDPNSTDEYKLFMVTKLPDGLKSTQTAYDLEIENTMTAEQAKQNATFRVILYCTDKKGAKSDTCGQTFSPAGPKQ